MADANPQGSTEVKTVPVEEFEKMRSRAQNFEAKVTDFEKRYSGIDPEAFKAMKEDYELMRKEKAGKSPEDLDKLIKDKESEFEKRYGKKFEEMDGMLKQQSSELKRLKVTNVVMKEAADVFHASALELIESVVNKDCDWSDDGIVIKDEQGKARMSSTDPRKPMDVKEYIGSLASKYEACAKATALPGAKQPGQKVNPQSLNGIKTLSDLSKLSNREQKEVLSSMKSDQIASLFQPK